jgi:hypothetical protein
MTHHRGSGGVDLAALRSAAILADTIGRLGASKSRRATPVCGLSDNAIAYRADLVGA